MAKKPKQYVTVKLHGLDIELNNVELKDIGRGKGNMFVHLEETPNGWHILHAGSPVITEMGDRLNLVFNRAGGDFLFLGVEGTEYGFAVSKATKINLDKCRRFIHLDELPQKMEYSFVWSKSFYEENSDIVSIELIREP